MIQVETGATIAEAQKVKPLPTSFSCFNENGRSRASWRVSST